MNLFQKLVEIRKAVPYLQKNQDGYKFKYASAIALLPPIKAKMDELQVLLCPEITEPSIKEIQMEEKGNMKAFQRIAGKINFTWINAENPDEKLTVPFFMCAAQKDPARAYGSALTYAERYFLLKFFNIPTGSDDPDHFNKKTELENEIYNGAEQAGISLNQFKSRIVHWCGQKWRINDLNRLSNEQAFDLIANIPNFVKAVKDAKSS